MIVKLPLHYATFAQTVNTRNSEEKARLKSLTLPHSGDWLNVVPSTALGLHLRPQEWPGTD